MNKTSCAPGTRRSSVPTRDWARLDLPVSVQEYPVVACVDSGLLWVRGTEHNSACTSPFEGGCHYCHYPDHNWASGQTTGKEHKPAHQQKIGLKICWARPHPSEQDLVSPTVSLSHKEVSVSLPSLSISEQMEGKPQSQKTNQTDHMDHILV